MRDTLSDYISSLDGLYIKRCYHLADMARLTMRDTLSDEFQIACEIIEVFERWAEKSNPE